ncbi:zinc ABC transporter substrate-binding protein [Alphaproteobacteria bacterium HT1-32]|nr:zinc ABC transporter substrate-binding protein [Alphaproteobacteria bacterium HT1-32]
MQRLFLPSLLLSFFFLSPAFAQVPAPRVVVSIPPLHSIVARVMQDVGEPDLLLSGGASPHAFSLKPSQARLLQDAGMVVYTGPGLERFLEHTLENIGSGTRIVEAMELAGVTVVARREGGVWEAEDHHEHEHSEKDAHGHAKEQDHDHAKKHDDHEKAGAHAGHNHGNTDPHIWLDPHNAEAIALQVAEHLSELDQRNADTYRRNARNFVTELEALEASLQAVLKPVADRKYVVFHDAYRYFEDHFGLTPVGAVTLDPESTPGVAQVLEIAGLIKARGAVCLFAEPQFEPRLVRRLAEGNEIRVGVLDPLGADLTPGPGLYPALMTGLAKAFASCLG